MSWFTGVISASLSASVLCTFAILSFNFGLPTYFISHYCCRQCRRRALYIMLTKLVILRKAMYQNAFLAFKNVDLLLSCLGSLS